MVTFSKREVIIDQFMFDIINKVELKIVFTDSNNEKEYSIMDINTMDEYIYVMNGEFKKKYPNLKPIEIIFKNVSPSEINLFNEKFNKLKQ